MIVAASRAVRRLENREPTPTTNCRTGPEIPWAGRHKLNRSVQTEIFREGRYLATTFFHKVVRPPSPNPNFAMRTPLRQGPNIPVDQIPYGTGIGSIVIQPLLEFAPC
jgi:hypothetical protein